MTDRFFAWIGRMADEHPRRTGWIGALMLVLLMILASWGPPPH